MVLGKAFLQKFFLLIFLLLSLQANGFNLSSASSLLPPDNTGIGGGNMIEIVFALFVLTEGWVFEVGTTFKSMLLLLLFWLLLILEVSNHKKKNSKNFETWGPFALDFF